MENAVEHTMSWLKNRSSLISTDIAEQERVKSPRRNGDGMMLQIREEDETDVKRRGGTENFDDNKDIDFPTIHQTDTMNRSEDEYDDKSIPTNDIEAVLEEGPKHYEAAESYVLEDHEYKIGDSNCLWTPSTPSGLRDVFSRTKSWFFLNGMQIAAGITGKFFNINLFSIFNWIHSYNDIYY